MPSETAREVYRQSRLAQDKYAYFLLAAAGAGIALAANQTSGDALSWSHAPLGGAVLAWGWSFFNGCQHLRYIGSSLYANLSLVLVEEGEHPKIGDNIDLKQAASEGIREAIELNNKMSQRYAPRQFHFLVFGAVLFVVWHVLKMYLRSVA